MTIAAAAKAQGPHAPMDAVRRYFGRIVRSVTTTFEGLAVTASWLFRRPITIQYPDKIEKPVQEMMPDGARGLLETDLDRCTGCLLCAKACPIDCITIELEKNAATGLREIRRFDIDIGRCMYCGLCAEACKFDSLVHSTDFEASAGAPVDLVLRFAREPQPVSKHKSGEGPARRPQGSILAEVVPAFLGRVKWRGKERKH